MPAAPTTAAGCSSQCFGRCSCSAAGRERRRSRSDRRLSQLARRQRRPATLHSPFTGNGTWSTTWPMADVVADGRCCRQR
eukprot:2590753-Prymnesium_polylepis.1